MKILIFIGLYLMCLTKYGVGVTHIGDKSRILAQSSVTTSKSCSEEAIFLVLAVIMS